MPPPPLLLLLLQCYCCHYRYSFCSDFVLGRFGYDSSLSHQIWIMPFTCQMHTNTHIHKSKWYTRVHRTPNMANECAFSIQNIFELYFIHRRYSYWWPLNLALAVGLWVGGWWGEWVKKHRGTSTFMLTHCFDLNICEEKMEWWKFISLLLLK